MRRLQRRNDALCLRKLLKRSKRSVVSDPGVFRASKVSEPCVFWTDGRVVQPRGDRMRELDIAVPVLQHVGPGALENTREACRKSCGMPPCRKCFATSFHTDQPN